MKIRIALIFIHLTLIGWGQQNSGNKRSENKKNQINNWVVTDAKAVVPIPNPDFDLSKYQPELIGAQQ